MSSPVGKTAREASDARAARDPEYRLERERLRIEAHREQSLRYAKRDPNYYLSGYPDMLMDEAEMTVVMTRAEVKKLSNYSASVPTGVYVDKCWLFMRPERGERFDEGKQLFLRVYRETDPPSIAMKILSYEILVVG